MVFIYVIAPSQVSFLTTDHPLSTFITLLIILALFEMLKEYMYFLQDFESIQAFKSSMITISDKYQDIDVLFVDPKINEKALTFFTLTDDDMPCLVMHDHVENQKFFRKNVTPDSIGEFVANFKVLHLVLSV